MAKMRRWIALMLCVLLLLLPMPDVGYCVPIRDIHPALLVSQRGRVLMVIEHETGVGNIAPIIAQMELDIHALEVIFQQLLDAGKLDDRYPTLVISAAFYGDTSSRFSHAATRLSKRSNTVVSGWGLSLEQIVQLRDTGRTIRSILPLGGAYVIDTFTGLLTISDLLAFVHLLPSLGQERAAIEVQSETDLEAAAHLVPRDLVRTLSFGIGPPAVRSSVYVESDFFRATWQDGRVEYHVRTVRGADEVALPMLPYYLERPVWGERFPRFIAFANAQTLTIIDRLDNSKFAVQLAELPSVAALTKAELRIAADPEQGAILFSFQGDRALGQAKSFTWELHTGLVSPLEGDFQMHLQARGLGEGAWANHHDRNGTWGEELAGFLVRRGMLSQREGEELTFLPTFIDLHVPSSERVDTRLLAYSSRTTLVVKDLLTGQANIVDLRALRPDDYHAIANIDMYSDFYGDEVCFVLTGHGISPAAYIWRAGVGLLGSTAVPTELNTLGWNSMRRGTPHSTFRDIRLETEEVSASLPRQTVSWVLLGAVYSLVQWSLLLFSSFGLPFVLSHALIINRAQSLAKAGNKMTNAAAVSGVQFVLLSLLCIFFLSYIVPAHLAWGDLPENIKPVKSTGTQSV
ncbi:MAG: hypothetical protein DDT33_00885 [Firmicutes bacterium]|nr:hypothetical protein [Bacillota bacterium]